MTTFEQAWDVQKAKGYRYGAEALGHVRFGWELAQAENEALRKALHNISLASQDSGSTREGMGFYARAVLAARQGEKPATNDTFSDGPGYS